MCGAIFYVIITICMFQCIMGTDMTCGIASRWKLNSAINPHITSTQLEDWQRQDAQLHCFLQEQIPQALAHTGASSFDAHLVGVQSVLRTWGAREDVCRAGLFHSIYGTEGFQGFKLPLSHRPGIRSLIGERAERLVWIFCMVDRASVDQTLDTYDPTPNPNPNPDSNPDSNPYPNLNPAEHVGAKVRQYAFRARLELGAFPIALQEDEWLDFLELTLADWLEQVEGASLKPSALFEWGVGEAWAYRRHAYAKMADILARSCPGGRLQRAGRMHKEVRP